MSVSVIIPCFNGAATIAATIASALAQNGCAGGILVVDDGSTDASLALARGFEPDVRVVTGPNRGVSAARNRGIEETGGEWVVFLDADDLLLAGTLRQRLDDAAPAGADVVICDWQELIDGGSGAGGPVRALDPGSLADGVELACATRLWAPTAALMYRRSLIEKIGGFRLDLPIIQDARFLFDAARHGARFIRSPHVGARYRVGPHSLSRRDPARFWRDVLLNAAQIEALWRGRGALSRQQREALAGIYDNAARGLFRAGDPAYFEAIDRQRRVGERLPLHPRIAGPLARAAGLRPARQLLGLIGR